MADDREPPALFDDDDADTPETKADEETNGNPFIGETTEIILDDGEPKEDETPEESDKATGNEGQAEASAAASVDVTNLSKPSKEDSEPAPKEKAEVGI